MQGHLYDLKITFISYSTACKHLQPFGIFYVKGFATEEAAFPKLKDSTKSIISNHWILSFTEKDFIPETS